MTHEKEYTGQSAREILSGHFFECLDLVGRNAYTDPAFRGFLLRYSFIIP